MAVTTLSALVWTLASAALKILSNDAVSTPPCLLQPDIASVRAIMALWIHLVVFIRCSFVV
jgi:hypothetical protein